MKGSVVNPSSHVSMNLVSPLEDLLSIPFLVTTQKIGLTEMKMMNLLRGDIDSKKIDTKSNRISHSLKYKFSCIWRLAHCCLTVYAASILLIPHKVPIYVNVPSIVLWNWGPLCSPSSFIWVLYLMRKHFMTNCVNVMMAQER